MGEADAALQPRYSYNPQKAKELLSQARYADGLDVEPVVTHTFPLAEARAAFDLAGDRTVASKVLLDLRD